VPLFTLIFRLLFGDGDYTRIVAAYRSNFCVLFNHETAVAVVGDDLPYATATHFIVQNQLRDPGSAVFLETFVRQCHDGKVRAAGTVQIAGLNGEVSRAGYMVEFESQDDPKLLDIVGNFDPVTVKVLPTPDQWDGSVIPYKRMQDGPSLQRRPVQPVYLGLVIAALLLILIIIGLVA
jgi:hypothetical protein